VGILIGPPVGLGGIVGTVASGFLADGVVRRTGRRNAMLRVSLVAVLLSLPFMAGFVFVREIQLALVCAGVMNLLLSAAIPPIMNYAIGLVGPRERGITATVVIILMGLVGEHSVRLLSARSAMGGRPNTARRRSATDWPRCWFPRSSPGGSSRPC
jgi:MFS family permease